MVITYYGALCFKIQSGETVIAFNPPSKESKYKSPRFASDIVLISANDKDYNGSEGLPGKVEGEKPFVANGCGEYEVSGVYIKGIESNGHANTVYGLSFEEISICHLGAMSEDIDLKIKESLGEIDILFIPIGDGGVLNPQKAATVAAHLGAKIVIPMNYNESQLKQFMKEFGSDNIVPADKFTVKKKDLAEKKGEIVVLKSVV